MLVIEITFSHCTEVITLAEFRTKINLTRRNFANFEGICIGPRLSDGRQLIILICDSQNQANGFLRDWFKPIVVKP
jgi:hypothetical protein